MCTNLSVTTSGAECCTPIHHSLPHPLPTCPHVYFVCPTQTKPTNKSDRAALIPGDILVAATAKHFVGDGGTQGGKDQGNTLVSEHELRRVHLPPYFDAIARGVESIMVSYSSWNNVKMHGNHHLISDVLKGELAFKGLVVSDWEAIQQLPGQWVDQVRRGRVLAPLLGVMAEGCAGWERSPESDKLRCSSCGYGIASMRGSTLLW